MNNRTHIENDADQILKLQHELSRILADVVDPQTGLREALERAVTLPGLDGVWTWFRTGDDEAFGLRHMAGLCDDLTAELDCFPCDSPVGRRLLQAEESVGNWQDIWPEKAEAIRRLGWSQVAVLPIVSQGEVVGALGGGRKSEVCLKGQCLWLLRTLANAIGSLLGSVRVEAAHRNQTANLTRLFDSFADRMFIVDGSGTVLHCNAANSSGKGSFGQDLTGRKLADVLPEYGHFAQRGTGDVASRHEQPVLSLHALLVDDKGEENPVEMRVDRGFWDGQPVDVVVCRDMAAHLALSQRNERLATAINHVGESIVITDRQGVIQYVNPAFCRMTGYSRREACGQNPRILKSGHHPDSFYRDMWDTLLRGENWSGKIVNRRRNGERFTEEATLSPVRDGMGRITHFVGVKRDVTRDLQLDNRLRERQKMEAVGTLAGGIAHDFNNILYALLGYVELALDDVPADHPAHSALLEVGRAGERASDLVAKMLTFGRRSDGRRDLVSLAEVVTEGLELVRASLPDTIEIETEIGAPDCRVMADVPQLHQVLLNLCQNGREALRDEKGRLKISVSEVELDAAAADELGGVQPGLWVCLKVTDNGRGIESSVLERIFEPYFTTRSGVEGHGLGLATVHGIVASHQGRVLVESEPGRGSEFAIYLPARTVTQPEAPAPSGQSGKVVGHGAIMVIDDEPMVAGVLEKALTRFGFEPHVFGNGVEALEVFRAAPHDFDAVITDQSMPNITGFELAAQMLALRPDLPLSLTTGYSDKVDSESVRAAGISCLLPKPLKIRELGRILVELTAAPVMA